MKPKQANGCLAWDGGGADNGRDGFGARPIMRRVALLSSLGLVILGTLPACAQQDTYESVMADCGGHIPGRMVDSCLERARVLNETLPSPQTQQLVADLSARAQHMRDRHDDQGGQQGYGGPNGQGYGPPPAQDGYGPPPGQGYGPPPGYDSQGQGDNGPNDQAPPPDRGRYDYQGPPPSAGPPDQMGPPPGYDQDRGASPGDAPPDQSGAADDTPPPDYSNAPDDTPPPEGNSGYDDGGPPPNDSQDDGPPPDIGPHGPHA
jgi:hypothetical protein